MDCLFLLEEFKLDYHLLFRDAMKGNPKLAKGWTRYPLNVPSRSKPFPPPKYLFPYLAALGLSGSTLDLQSVAALKVFRCGTWDFVSCGDLVVACEL